MIQFSLRLTSRPGGTHDMVKALRSVMLPTERKRGCQRCRLCADVGQPESLWYTEEWDAAEDLDQHIRSEQFSRLLAVIESAAKPPVIDFRLVSHLRGLDYIETVRAGLDSDWTFGQEANNGSAA